MEIWQRKRGKNAAETEWCWRSNARNFGSTASIIGGKALINGYSACKQQKQRSNGSVLLLSVSMSMSTSMSMSMSVSKSMSVSVPVSVCVCRPLSLCGWRGSRGQS
eukprot:2219682-Rhodomonas_salina.2